ncbi:MAG: sulfatase [Candidatus Nealsonbacteria bacterium]|nr:sulfatase [Candidatus Nealsonbacteria bacterium]
MHRDGYDRRAFLRKIGIVAAAWLLPCIVGAAQQPGSLNIVLFVADDHGWADSGAYGDRHVKTPHIDRLAKEAMRFTRAFAASPLCSPSRCVIATGLMPHRNGGHKFGTPITTDVPTMSQHFKRLGYYTAHFGKFHHAPAKRFPYDLVDKDENRAAKFIAQYDGERPLLLVVCTHPPHTPWVENESYDPSTFVLPPNFVDTPETRQDRADYYSDVTLMDRTLGDVLQAIERSGLQDHSLLVYTSDQGSNWPFSKWCVYDGGLRVPLIVRWPGRVAKGSVSDAMVSLADLLPTLIEAAAGDPPADIDGRSFLPVLTGNSDAHRTVVFGTHTGNDNGGPGIANHCPARTIRTATHRYIFNLSPETTFTTHITGCKKGAHYLPHWDSWVARAKTDEAAARIVHAYQHRPREELYDVVNDPHEMNNLAGRPECADVQASLRKQLVQWCQRQGDPVAVKALSVELEHQILPKL